METKEPCPQMCGATATCRHGIRDERNRHIHEWNCPNCGVQSAIVLYDCVPCSSPHPIVQAADASATAFEGKL